MLCGLPDSGKDKGWNGVGKGCGTGGIQEAYSASAVVLRGILGRAGSTRIASCNTKNLKQDGLGSAPA